MRSIVSSLLLLVSLVPQLFASEPPVIIVIGDSLSAAFGMQQDQAWPSLLQNRLQNNGYDHRIFNSSIAGDTTQGGLARLPGLLQKYQPELVLIELGANDGLRGLSVDTTGQNLAQMIANSQQAGAKVLLSDIRLPPNYGRAYTDKFQQLFSNLAEQFNIGLIPFLLEDIVFDPQLMMADGIHPTAAAQPLLLEVLWPFICGALSPPAP